MSKTTINIKEQHPDFNSDPVKVDVIVDKELGTLEIFPAGYEHANGGSPIYMEIYKGELRLVVWSDINKEDPTHIINMQEANLVHLQPRENHSLQ
jgi:hypothetical protein